jgi:ATPase subunit of ABC transporter with duplicated ATPase domains
MANEGLTPSFGGGAVGAGAQMGFAVGGPVGAGVGALLGLGGEGLMSWLDEKKKDEENAKAEKRYNQELAIQQQQWQAQFDLSQKQFNLSRTEMINKMKNDRETNKQFYDQRNYERINNYSNRLLQLVNTDQLRNKYTETWGGK